MDEGHCLESFPVASVKYPRHVWFMATQQDAIKCDPQIPQGEACMSPAEPFCPPSHAGSAGPLLPPPTGNRRGLRGGGGCHAQGHLLPVPQHERRTSGLWFL